MRSLSIGTAGSRRRSFLNVNDNAAIGNIDVEADPVGGKYFGNGGRCRKSFVRFGGRRKGGGILDVVVNVPKSSEGIL